MFTFAWGVYSSLFAEQAYKVLIIGLESSGKTTLMEQIKHTYSGKCNTTAGNSNNTSSNNNRCNSNSSNDNTSNNRSAELHTGASSAVPTVAPVSVMRTKRIRPTVGLNMAHVTHRMLPPQLYRASHGGSVSRESHSDCHGSDSMVLHTSSTSASLSVVMAAYTPMVTRLTLWDVGAALQGIWSNYFSSCHGVVFVVDSTLACSSSTTTATRHITADKTKNFSPTIHTMSDMVNEDGKEMGSPSSFQSKISFNDSSTAISPTSCRELATVLEHPINDSEENGMICSPSYGGGEEGRQLRRKAYTENAAVLREVFRHPLLADAPLLILSNKSDVMEHTSLAEMQEALGLVEMALMQHAYDTFTREDTHSRRRARSASGSGDSDVFASSMTSTGVSAIDSAAAAAEAISGTSGIGTKIMRLTEISALDGTGVREAMDWLVVQMRESKRVAEMKDT